MSLISKISSTITAKRDPAAYVTDVDSDLLTLFRAMRTVPSVTQGIVAPTSTPRQIGDIYVDTVAKKLYFASGVDSSADWTIAN